MLPRSPSWRRRGRIAALVTALTLAVAACTGSAGTTSAPPAPDTTGPGATVAPTTSAGGDGRPTTTLAAPTTTAPPTTTTTAAPELEVITRVGEGVDAAVAEAVRAEVTALMRATEQVRGLTFLEPPDLAIVTEAELVELIRADVVEDLEGIEVEGRLLELLGLLEPGIDLRQLILDLLAEQVLGFYDGATGEMVVKGDAAGLSALTKITVVHELIHALTDQHFDYFGTLEALVDGDRLDEASALQALLEGDATYFQLVYVQEELGLAELVALQSEVADMDFSVLESSPEFLQADLEFPYDEGFKFVTRLVADGGIAAVDAAYQAIPTTTEQIIHPELYVAGELEAEVALPDTPLDGYQVYEESRFGEWGLNLLFFETEDRGMITELGTGWGGDRYRILDNGTDVVLVLRYVGDTEADAIDMARAFLRLFEARFGEGAESGPGQLHESDAGYGYLDRDGREILLVVASDPAAGAAVRQTAEG